jgi:hypothetical protein
LVDQQNAFFSLHLAIAPPCHWRLCKMIDYRYASDPKGWLHLKKKTFHEICLNHKLNESQPKINYRSIEFTKIIQKMFTLQSQCNGAHWNYHTIIALYFKIETDQFTETCRLKTSKCYTSKKSIIIFENAFLLRVNIPKEDVWIFF